MTDWGQRVIGVCRPSHDHRGIGSPAGTDEPTAENVSTSATAHSM
jgi:hypothetical protein